MQTKDELRKEMLEVRRSLDPKTKANYDRKICDLLLEEITSKHWKTVHCYLPIHTEIDIWPLIKKLVKQELVVVCPKTLQNRKLDHFILGNDLSIRQGLYGTSFPASGEPYNGSYDVIVVPGLAFSDEGHRLGYGGGYYDSFLALNPSASKLGLAYPFQIKEEIPIEPHDEKLDKILYFNAL